MKKILVIVFILSYSLALFSQKNMYWIKFKDKNNNSCSLSNPQQFLSQKSIVRRTKQNIALDESDLPLTQSYLDSVTPYISKLVHRLKWSNLIVAQIDTLHNIDSIRRFSFVENLNEIQFFPDRSAQNKFEDIPHPVDQNIVYPNKYGIAFNQINMLNGDLLHQLGYRGQGITISMMDNGFVHVDSIPAFDSVRPQILGTWDFVHQIENVYADGGHGTSTFSCIAGNLPGKYIGTAPDANFYLFHTEQTDAEWVMEEYNWAAAAEVADSCGVQVFSTSLGYTTFNDGIGSHTYADLTGDKTVITHAGNVAAGKGILVFTAAGNEGDSTSSKWHYISTPGDGNDIITIGAVDSARNITNFSSRGPNAAGVVKPDLCSQGANSGVIAGNSDIVRGIKYGDAIYNGGTSFSCPILAGCAASLWSAFPDSSARVIKEAIIISADRFWTPDSSYGYGIPNFYTAYLILKTNYNGNIIRADQGTVIFPNPFSDELYLSLYNSERKNHLIEIFDLTGRKVYTTTLFLRDKSYDIARLEGIQTLMAGEYILRLDGDKKFSYRLVKAK